MDPNTANIVIVQRFAIYTFTTFKQHCNNATDFFSLLSVYLFECLKITNRKRLHNYGIRLTTPEQKGRRREMSV